jgi:hypothetical protein
MNNKLFIKAANPFEMFAVNQSAILQSCNDFKFYKTKVS